jgi:hypothetical protein
MGRHFLLDLINSMFVGVLLFFAMVVGNIASFYIDQIFN